jgi:hypothetical protein
MRLLSQNIAQRANKEDGDLGGDLVSACEGFRQAVQRDGRSASAN